MSKKLITSGMLMALLLVNPYITIAAQHHAMRFESNLFTQMEHDTMNITSPNSILEGFEKVAENQYLELFVHSETLSIKVRNKANDYLWSSTIDDLENQQLNQTWQQFVESAITLDFLDQSESLTRESLTSNQSEIEFSKVANGFIADIVFSQSNIALQLSVQLDGRDLVVTIPDESIEERGSSKLVSAHVYPFWGATYEDQIPGYMFIPDGAGALIRYGENSVKMESPYQAAIYGENLGTTRTTLDSDLNSPYQATMPIFGMVHGVNQNACLGIVESGDNHAHILAYTAGLTTEFNWITAQFTYRDMYSQPTTQDESRGHAVDLFQEERNKFDINIRYRILEDEVADYVGMALAYQGYLIDLDVLQPLEEAGPQMRLEFLGGEVEDGLIWDKVVPMTTITAIPDYMDRLQEQGLEELLVVYRGWSRGGLTRSLPNRFPFESKLGSQSDVRKVVGDLAAQDIPMFFHTDYTRSFARGNRLFGNSDLVQHINTRLISDSESFYLIPEVALQQAQRDLAKYESYEMNHLAIDTTASTLFSVFNRGLEATRQDNREVLEELVLTLNEGQMSRTALYEPNAYAWELTNKYFDIPMDTSRHLFVTDTVPFIQIVLRGYMDYYAPVSNFSANQRQDLLKMIDYGAYPSFLLTSEASHLLADTGSRNIFTSEFDIWEETVVEHYQEIAKALNPVLGQQMVAREMLATGVVKVSYANEVQIIVNYTNSTFTDGNLTIEAEDFIVVKGE